MRNPDHTSHMVFFPDDGPDYDPEQQEDIDVEPSEAELEYLRNLTATQRPKRHYGDEDQDDLMDMIDRPND